MAALLTSTVVTGLAPIVVFLWPAPPKGQKKAPIKVTLTKAASEIQNGEAVQFYAPKTPNSAFVMTDGGGDNAAGDLAFGGFLVKDGSGTLNAFAINCSHLGCSIALNAKDGSFDCPCHGSRFHLDGTVRHGPAAYPLSHLKWAQDTTDPTTITVDGIILGF
jgi:Rieske Fe-S protein